MGVPQIQIRENLTKSTICGKLPSVGRRHTNFKRPIRKGLGMMTREQWLKQQGLDQRPPLGSGEYLGFSNQETWNTHLWITNDYSLYSIIGQRAERCRSVLELANWIEDLLLTRWVNRTPDGNSLGPVNWVEVAATWADANELFYDERSI